MRKNPLLIGNLPKHYCKTPYQRSLLKGRCPYLGDIWPKTISSDDPVLEGMEQVCKERGFKFYRKPDSDYGDKDYTVGAGTAFTHTDPSMGLTAGCLVATAPITPAAIEPAWAVPGGCSLVANGKELELGIGDCFVFNADFPHMWVANCRWAIATISIRECRIKKS